MCPHKVYTKLYGAEPWPKNIGFNPLLYSQYNDRNLVTQASNFFCYKDIILMSHTVNVESDNWTINCVRNWIKQHLSYNARTKRRDYMSIIMNLTFTTELIIVIVALFISVISFLIYSCTCDSIAHINNIFFFMDRT